MSYWVYVLQNPKGNFYVGQTGDLELRLEDHNRTDQTAGKFTRKTGPWTLVWSEEHAGRSSAMLREREIKRWKSSKMIRKCLLGIPE